MIRNGAWQRCYRAWVRRGAADLRIFGSLYRREAEAAFSIEKPWQSLGIGAALLERSLLAARNRGVKLLHVCCLVENQRMQQLARKFEATSLSISAR
jgi:GNAT superfamily N-acetyltransferase